VAQPAASQPEPSSWVSRCASATRQSVPECFIEQTVVLTKTGQLIASVTVRLPPTTNKPVMMIQTPVGLYLPAGVAMQVDEAPPLRLVVQTCDTKGCYAGDQISPQLLETMKAGKRLSVIFQNLEKKDISVQLTLAQFAEAYQRIQ
jgi:invasion protein IalB